MDLEEPRGKITRTQGKIKLTEQYKEMTKEKLDNSKDLYGLKI